LHASPGSARDFWDGAPTKQADWIRMATQRDGRTHFVVAELWTHLFGWELRMLIEGAFSNRKCVGRRMKCSTLSTRGRGPTASPFGSRNAEGQPAQQLASA